MHFMLCLRLSLRGGRGRGSGPDFAFSLCGSSCGVDVPGIAIGCCNTATSIPALALINISIRPKPGSMNNGMS